MLVFTRRNGDGVVIGNPDKPIGVVRVMHIRGGKVRLGFEFPRSTPVHREEVAGAIAGVEAEPKQEPR